MERVLREPDIPEVDALFARAFDLDSGLAFYPVRHHSPACAYHLRETIRRYRPDVICIEGPSDAAHLLPYLAHSDSKPPICIYYSYDDRQGRVSEEKEKYRAYYPFLEYSPEWVAIREAQQAGARLSFIDLPYALRLVNRLEPAQIQYRYNENGEYEVNRYTALLAEKAGCRSFSEFWESRFELEARGQSTAEFVRGVFSLGYFMRRATPVEAFSLQDDRQREWYMAQRVGEALKENARVLVVTGAFHVQGLLEQLEKPEPVALKPCSEQDVASYLMPYTFREADSRSGYSAGIPFPAYYQSVWEKMRKQKKEDVYTSAALEYIVKTARYARRTQAISIPDEINAYAMARSLAVLRGKASPGVYELLDGVRSAFVKGDINSTATFELDFLLRMLSGMGAGSVVANDCVPSVVREFRALCAKYKLKTGTVERQPVVLDIVKNPAHYAKSRFLHQLSFLETGYCNLDSGPDYVNGRDKNLVRESWICRYSTAVETRLIDLSVYGASLSQVCASLIEKRFQDSLTARELGKLLLSVQVMGVDGFFSKYQPLIYEVVENDRNFVSLCQFIGSLRYLANMQRLMEGDVYPEIPDLIRKTFRAAVQLMPDVRGVTEDEEQPVCSQLRELHALTVEQPDWSDRDAFLEQVHGALEDGFCNSRFYGTCLAIESKQGRMLPDVFCERVTSYLESCLESPDQAASFICGVFLVARDVLFADDAVMERIDNVIAAMDGPRFMEVLPNLRYADRKSVV